MNKKLSALSAIAFSVVAGLGLVAAPALSFADDHPADTHDKKDGHDHDHDKKDGHDHDHDHK